MMNVVFPSRPERQQTGRRMSQLLLLWLVAIGLSHSVLAYGQPDAVKIPFERGTLKQVLDIVEQQSTVRFLYLTETIDPEMVVVVDQQLSARAALEKIFEQHNIVFTQQGNQIVLKKRTSTTPKPAKPLELPTVSAVKPAQSAAPAVVRQQQVITGQVTAVEDNEPLPGVSVMIAGTAKGTITDIDGKYSLEAASGEQLVFSFVGFLSQTVTVSQGQTQVNVALEIDVQQLEEVVVIGYGAVKKRDLTGAVSSVKSGDIKMAPVISPVEALQGRVAGMDITRTSGSAGAGMSILLRGNRSLTASSEPIYIIDGIQGNINNLNPYDIESIEVLKDASSTAIYGSAGANGVIIITTKKADKDKVQVDFNSYLSVNRNPSYPSPLQGDAWLQYLEDAYVATNGEASADRDALLLGWNLSTTALNPYLDSNKYVNWVDETFQTGIQTNNTISVRGGSDKIKASFSLGHNKTQGVYRNDQVQVYTLRGDMNVQANKWSKFGIITGLIYKDQMSNRSRVNKSFGIIPLGEAYDENGDINAYPISEAEGTVSVLANDIPGTFENSTKYYNVTVNPYAEFQLGKNLTFRSRLGISLSNTRNGVFKSDHTYLMLAGSELDIRSASFSTNQSQGLVWENFMNYSRNFGDHEFGATLITAYQINQNENSYADSDGFLYDDFKYYNLSAGINPHVSSRFTEKKQMSYAGRLNYNYQAKYLITASARYDGVSQLANKWDLFPAAAIAWRISDESFMSWTEGFMTDLKLRAGYGVTGNSNIDPYVTKSEVTSGTDRLNLGNGQVITSIPTQAVGNLNLGWEKSYNLNIGLDFGLIKNRITGAFEYYDTDTRDVIYARALPYSSGGYTAKIPYQQNANVARMQNKGVELTLNTKNIDTKEFQWSTSFTFSRNKEKVVSIDLGEGTAVEDLISLGLFMGLPRDVFYDYEKLGIWQESEALDAAAFGLAPGDVKTSSNLTKVSDGIWISSILAPSTAGGSSFEE